MDNPYRALFRLPPRRVFVIRVHAFYTNFEYRAECAKLETSMGRYGIAYETCFVAGKTTWAEAVLAKPRFILDCLLKSSSDGILYTDADSLFRKAPDWGVFKDADVAWHEFTRVPGGRKEPLTGTMFFRLTSVVKAFVEDWTNITQRFSGSFTPEQDSLSLVWPRWKDQLRYVDPGPEWCWIFDEMPARYPEKSPIVEHYQKSRVYRNVKAASEKEAPAKAEVEKTSQLSP